MNASLRKIGALLQKDFSDFFKNPTMLVVSLMPIAFMMLYRFMIGDVAADQGLSAEQASAASREVLKFLLGCALCLSIGMAGSMTVIYGIAEEKEKHTLRTLMLANVSAGQVVVAKSVLALVVIAVVEAGSFFAAGGELEWLGAYMALGIAGALPVVLVALVLGLASRDQATAGVYGVPVLLLTMVPIFGMTSPDIARVAEFTPCGGIYNLMGMVMDGAINGSDALMPVAVTLAWVVAGAALFAVMFKRLTRDN